MHPCPGHRTNSALRSRHCTADPNAVDTTRLKPADHARARTRLPHRSLSPWLVIRAAVTTPLAFRRSRRREEASWPTLPLTQRQRVAGVRCALLVNYSVAGRTTK